MIVSPTSFRAILSAALMRPHASHAVMPSALMFQRIIAGRSASAERFSIAIGSNARGP